ncbi:MAG: class I SAM-dependent methyltransferase [Gemmatimonadota bacterium]|nr:class I SAM-dependent methyltransferase [Gemmatimonadota bacterium]
MLFPRRIHAVELLDSPRCPAAVRDGATDYLQFIIRAANAYGAVAPVIARVLATRSQLHIVDTCSGGGGPWPQLRAGIVAAGAPAALDVTLTDRFPNRAAFLEISARDSQVRFRNESIDIEREVEHRRGLRTMFSAFHHFSPAVAERVIRKLAANRDEIFIAEVTQRSARAILFMLLAPLLVWITTPMLRPFRLSRILLTYLVPIIPFVVCFDGIVSCLRSYTRAELHALFSSVADLDYEWTTAEAKGNAPMPVTYASGVPRVRPT